MSIMSRTFVTVWRACYGSYLGVLFLLLNFAPVQAANTTMSSTPSATIDTIDAPSTIEFSSAVQLASSISFQLTQLANIPAIPIPTNITAFPEYEIVSRLAPAMPPIQAGVAFPDADSMIADLISSTNVSGSSGSSLAGRQSALRVMVVGDSMSQGKEGDYTWRYRIWQFFQQNNIDVEMVGPYTGTVPPDPATPPTPPILYGETAPSSMIGTNGGYAADVDSAFLSNSNHFAVWGMYCRAVAVDKGLIQGVLESTPADLILFMLGFNDMGWFYSDAPGTISSVSTFVTNARAANPNVKFALANVPQRSFLGGRQDLVDNTEIYNQLLPEYIAQWTTTKSPISLVQLEENYDCQPGGCPAGYDGLHPNAWGEYQIANAFSQTLVNDFQLGTTPIAVPAQDDSSLTRPLPIPSNFQVFSSPQGVTATWDAVYGAYGYDVSVSINGGGNGFSATSSSFNRWDSQWPLSGWTYAVAVRAQCGDNRVGGYTSTLSAEATPQLADPPQNVVVEPTADGFTVTWDAPSGANDGSIIEYNVIYWDSYYLDCQYISGAAFTSSPAVITGLVPGKSYLIAPVTWNENGQGLPTFANNAVPGAGTPSVPTDLVVVSNDPTTIHATWTGSDSAGGYHLWSRSVDTANAPWKLAGNITHGTCADSNWLFPGTWHYEWSVTAFNGNEESAQAPAVLAPSPASTVTEGSPGPTCPPAPSWCPAGAGASVPTESGGTLPTTGLPTQVTSLETITTDGVTITLTPLPTATVETLTEPDGSTITLTLPSGSPVITGLETITTDGSTLTVGPAGSFTETLTEPDGSTIVLTFPSGSPVITGLETITEDGSTLTVGPAPTGTINPGGGVTETLTEPDGSLVTLTFPSGSPIITGLETITTDGSTLTVGPSPTTVTSTMTTLPPGVSFTAFTEFPITTNIWYTTTGSDSSTTIVPVLLPCPTCQAIIIWNVPEIPWVEFKWPQLPELPSFHFPCIKIFGIHIAGDCPSPSGPPPVDDGPPPDPEPTTTPGDTDDGSDPCELETSTGMCDNGNYPVFDPNSGTISCDGSTTQLDQCQQNIDDNIEAVQSYLENEQSCCSTSSKAKRQASGGVLSLLNRGLDSLGLSQNKRADYCPAPGQNPKEPPAGTCYATYTCPHMLYPNVCGNAKSAILHRGATSILTHHTGSTFHDTKPWYWGHYRSYPTDNPAAGWELDKCQPEEYPFGSGNPSQVYDGTSVLRLIPGAGFEWRLENQLHGTSLARWVQGIATDYNNYQKELTKKQGTLGRDGIVYCVEFDPIFTNYLPEDLVNENFCAWPYGPQYTLVNDFWVNGVRTWDPWFDVSGTNRKSLEFLYYVNAEGTEIDDTPNVGDHSVYGFVPPTYCYLPSPGAQTWNNITKVWEPTPGFGPAGRSNIPTDQMCIDPPGQATMAKRGNETLSVHAETNQTRVHPRDLTVRQLSSTGGFLDPNVYIYMGCLTSDAGGDGDGDDPCAGDIDVCPDPAADIPSGNGIPVTADPIGASTESGYYSTGPIPSTAFQTSQSTSGLATPTSIQSTTGLASPTSTTPTATSTVSALPDLIFCYIYVFDKSVAFQSYTYQWFADNGRLNCSTVTDETIISSVSANTTEEESTYHYPYGYTPMGDLTLDYPGFFDCQFITQYNGNSGDDALYGAADQGSSTGSIGCNDSPGDETTVDALYGFCNKEYEVVTTSTGEIFEELFRCTMANPRA